LRAAGGGFGEVSGALLFLIGGGGGLGDGAHEEIQGVVDGLEPGAHFVLEAAGEEADGLAHSDDGATDGDAGVGVVHDLLEACGDGEEGLASAGLPIAGDEVDFGVEEGVKQAGLTEVHGLDGATVAGFDGLGDVQETDEFPGRIHFRGHGGLFCGDEEDVVVDDDAGEAGWGDFEGT
jgi:hypothetical protein